MSTGVIIVAAGSGTRAGGQIPKQYQMIGSKPVICHTLEAFLAHPDIDHIQLVIGHNQDDLYADALGDYDIPAPVAGGNTRQASVFAGLKAMQSRQPDNILIHDAARPFVSSEMITKTIAALDEHAGAIPGLPVTDTIKQVSGDLIESTIDREQLRAVQTPQGFIFETIFNAHKNAEAQAVTGLTDDASILEWAGIEVAIIAGDPANTKLTTADDIKKADAKMTGTNPFSLTDIRVGQGFDVHAFEPGDHVILCGIKLPHTAKLKGHSDADVAMHALTDAILGAISEGDIGSHFPPSDPQWKGAASAIFLKGANDLVKQKNGVLAHCDITIICEAPKLRPFIDDMRKTMAEILGLEISRMSIKATTSEQLGFTGRREGIAAMATATVRLPEQD